ncbi:ABC transporter substrate-binding protein [Numidum massiliense]|uniref:ABC transporter substrate-binding protein n=1 Tax=Numidum massiliense TaxID=1522315 RepID=UPI0006D52F8D|nr:extracellular solute-binding protein [Numidum massiliense]
MKRAALFACVWLTVMLGGCTFGQAESQVATTESTGGGTVRVWIAGEQFPLKAFQAFTEATGIAVQPQFGDERDFVRQVLQHKGQPQADLFWSDNALDLAVLAGRGAFEAYRSPHAAKIPSTAKDSDGLWYGLTERRLALLYKPAKLSDDKVPKTLDQLEQFAHKGKIGVPAPSSSLWTSAGAAIVPVQGEFGMQSFFSGLKEWNVYFAKEDPPGAALVLEEKVPLLLSTSEQALRHMSKQRKDAKHTKDAALRIQPLVADNGEPLNVTTGIGILRGTEKKKEAEQFIDFMLREQNRSDLATARMHEALASTGPASRLHPDEMVQLSPLIAHYLAVSFPDAP